MLHFGMPVGVQYNFHEKSSLKYKVMRLKDSNRQPSTLQTLPQRPKRSLWTIRSKLNNMNTKTGLFMNRHLTYKNAKLTWANPTLEYFA